MEALAGPLSPLDLEALIAGIEMREIDVKDWQMHAKGIAERSHPDLARFFWESLEEMNPEQRTKVLGFACGSLRVPATGFQALSPPFELSVTVGADPNSLPTAHTCVNQLCLPVYKTKEELKEKLLLAMEETQGFGFV